MKRLLESYIQACRLTGKYELFNEEIEAGLHSLGDEKACGECSEERKICTDADENAVLKLSARTDMHKVNIEKFFAQFDGTNAAVEKKCDLLLYNDANAVFCEMTCSLNKYIEPYSNSKGVQIGKRAGAYNQMKNVMEALFGVADIKDRLAACCNKVGLFAVRLKDTSTPTDEVEKNMKTLMQEFENPQACQTDMGNGFLFQTIVYPEIYHTV